VKLSIIKPSSPAEKRTMTTLDTIEITESVIATWKSPPFQRGVRVNDKLRSIAEQIARDGIIPGTITLGVLGKDIYLLDGQHRIEGYRLSGISIACADVRYLHCDSMGQMGEEFVQLNSSIVKFRPDDILRGLEASYSTLRTVRERCKFVGYDMIRRGDRAPILSMSVCLRVWAGSRVEVPISGGVSAAALGQTLTQDDADQLVGFLNVCFEAWGRDQEYAKLWGALNLILCAWLYRRLVVGQYSSKTPKLTKDMFRQCLMSESADHHYLDWLVGRNLGDRDRSPAYNRLKKIFAARLVSVMGKKPALPAPAWANG
jgi:hypothetical protein